MEPDEKNRRWEIKEQVYDSWDDEEIEYNNVSNWYFDKDSYIILFIDFIIFLGSFYTWYCTPLTLAESHNFIAGISLSNCVIEWIIDITNCLDVVFSFFKPFYNQEEVLVVNIKYIIIEYLFSWFILDSVSAIPFNSWTFLNSFNREEIKKIPMYYNTGIYSFKYFLCWWRILKFVKVWWYNKFTQFLERFFWNFDHFSNWSRVYISLILFFTSLHFLTCIYIHIGWIEYPNWISSVSLETSGFADIYIASLYFNLTTIISVGYGDMVSYSFTEKTYNLILLFFGVMIYSWAVSSMSTHITASQMKYQDFDNKKQLLAEIQLTHRELPGSLYDNIMRYIKYKFDTESNEKNWIYNCLPIGWRNNWIMEMYKPVINNFVFFKNYPNPDFIIRVILAFNPLIYVKNDIWINEGQFFSDLFFIKKGRLSLQAPLPIIVEKNKITEMSTSLTFKAHNTTILNNCKWNDLLSTNELTYTYLYNSQIISSDVMFLRKHSDLVNIYKHGKTYIEFLREKLSVSQKYKKLLEFRENEHFGNSLMFLNKLSPFRAKIKSKECEWFTLNKTDATEISTTYPEYWKIIHEKAIFNLEQIEGLINIILERFFFHFEGEKYKLNSQLIKLLNLKKVKPSNFHNLTLDTFVSLVSPLQTIPDHHMNNWTSINNNINTNNHYLLNQQEIEEENESNFSSGRNMNNSKDNLTLLLVSYLVIFLFALLPKKKMKLWMSCSSNSSEYNNDINSNHSSKEQSVTKMKDYSINEEFLSNEYVFPKDVAISDKQKSRDKMSNCSINKEGYLYNFVENSKEIDFVNYPSQRNQFTIGLENSFTITSRYTNVYMRNKIQMVNSSFYFEILKGNPNSGWKKCKEDLLSESLWNKNERKMNFNTENIVKKGGA